VWGGGDAQLQKARERGAKIVAWIWSYRFCVVEQGEVGPGEVEEGSIPILGDSKSSDNGRQFGHHTAIKSANTVK
jgi:hypothetical protein